MKPFHETAALAACAALLSTCAVTSVAAGVRARRRAEAERFTFYSQRVSVRRVFQMIARAGRLNLLLHRQVRGMVGVRLKNATIEQALRHVASKRGLRVHEVEILQRTYVVLPRSHSFLPLRFGHRRDVQGGFTLKAEDVDVSKIIQMISRAGRLKVVLGPNIRGKMPIELTHVPFLIALELVALVNGWEIVEDPTIPRVFVIRAPARRSRRLTFAPPIDRSVPRDFTIKAEGLAFHSVLRQIGHHAGIDFEMLPGLRQRRFNALELDGVRPLEALKVVCIAMGCCVEAIPGRGMAYRVE